MALCKYFLQGTCKFGGHCNFLHEAPSSIPLSNGQSSIIKPFPNQSNESREHFDLIKVFTEDMKAAVNGLHWYLTCYGPIKEKCTFPGFEDISLEEVRLGYYLAKKNNTSQQYMLELQSKMNNAMSKFKLLQNADKSVLPTLLAILNGSLLPNEKNSTSSSTNIFKINNSTKSENIFAQPKMESAVAASNSNIFSNNNNTRNIFTQNKQQTNIFAISPNNTAIQRSNNIFQTSGPSENIFANKLQQLPGFNTIFQPSPFTNSYPAPAIQSRTNFFSQPSNNSSHNIFAQQSPNIFSSEKDLDQSIFDMETPPSTPLPSTNDRQQNIFRRENETFANRNLPTNINPFAKLEKPENQLMEDAPIVNENPFTKQLSSDNPFKMHNSSNNIFLNKTPQNSSTSIFGTSNTVRVEQDALEHCIYSKLEELSEAEQKWYGTDEYDIENIPLNPPAHSMCFKT